MAKQAWSCHLPAVIVPILLAVYCWRSEGCPVRLLNVDTHDVQGESSQGHEALSLSEAGLEYLRRQRSPLYIVPALGVYRGGKSMLLNRLMGLSAPYAGGFGIGHSQETHTRGIDICAEDSVEFGGTIVWMDTEGLFSSEDARSALGPKIFSLALLFSSTVILNSVKVLNDQFFAFFGDQQQIARVLRQGLVSEGLRVDALLPSNLSVFWVVQQPVRFDSDPSSGHSQLRSFFAVPGDETRALVNRDFHHRFHQVPVAVNDVRKWSHLDELPDEELESEYHVAVSSLRASVLESLRHVRPLQATSVATQFQMYMELVRTESFSGSLAKEAFEEAEISVLCSELGERASVLAGELPSASLHGAIATARDELEEKKAVTMETFHFGAGWAARLERCYQNQAVELQRRNADLVLARWQKAAGEVAENGQCFFLGTLSRLLRDYIETYGDSFDHQVQSRAVDYASALQRARLTDCVRLRDFLWPFAPWLAWPVCSIYLRSGALSGIFSLALHAVVLAGVYAVLQLFNQLPAYLDVDYPVLRTNPLLLYLAMRAPPMVPWATFARVFGLLGVARSTWKLLRCVANLARPAGHGYTVDQLINLELKLNMLLKRTEADMKQQLSSAALEAAEHLEANAARGAARCLMRGLCLVRELQADDQAMSAMVDASLRRRIHRLLRDFRLPPPDADMAKLCRRCGQPAFSELVAAGDWPALLKEMATVLENLGDSPTARIAPGRIQSTEAHGVQDRQRQLDDRLVDSDSGATMHGPGKHDSVRKNPDAECSEPESGTMESEAEAEPEVLDDDGRCEEEDEDDEGGDERYDEVSPYGRAIALGVAVVATAAACVLAYLSGAAAHSTSSKNRSQAQV